MIGAVAGVRAHRKRHGSTITKGPLNRPVIIDGVQVLTDLDRDHYQGKRSTKLHTLAPFPQNLTRRSPPVAQSRRSAFCASTAPCQARASTPWACASDFHEE